MPTRRKIQPVGCKGIMTMFKNLLKERKNLKRFSKKKTKIKIRKKKKKKEDRKRKKEKKREDRKRKKKEYFQEENLNNKRDKICVKGVIKN